MTTQITEVQKFMQSDLYGNKIFFHVNVLDGKAESGELWLQLRGEQRQRKIGRYVYADHSLHIQRSAEKHLHTKSASYGLNYGILAEKDMFEVHTIYLRETLSNRLYCFPVALVMQAGQFLFFKEQGFELQIFVPVKEIDKYEVV